MNETPTVSVILPVYNVEAYLRECLDSIRRQTFGDFELICIDDGSTDSSGAILDAVARQDPRLRVFHQPNGGVSQARNRGLSLARGEYLYLCDPDDLCKPRLLEKLYRKARKDDADVVCCQRESFDCRTGTYMGRLTFPDWLWRVPAPFSGEDIADRLLSTFGSSTVDKLISSRLVEENGIRFQTDVRRFALFYFTSMALVLAKRISLVPDSLYRYRENRPGSLQSSREQSPMDAFRTRASFADELRRRGIFEKFEIGYLQSLLRIGRSQLRVLREPANRQAVYMTLMKMAGELMTRPGFPLMEFSLLPEYWYWRELLSAGGPGETPPSGQLRNFDLTDAGRAAWRERFRCFWGAFGRRLPHASFRRESVFDGWRLKLDFLEKHGGRVCFDGRFYSDRANAEDLFRSLSLVREANGERLALRLFDQSVKLPETQEYGEMVRAWRFTCSYPALDGQPATYRWQSDGDALSISWQRVEHTRYSPFTNLLRYSHAVLDGCLFSFGDDRLAVRPATVCRRTVAEFLLCLNLLKKRSKVALKALVLRWCVRLLRACRHRPQWLFSDRFNVADDNGRALYEYVRSLPAKERPPRAVLALSAAASQFEELSAKGSVVNADSFRYKLEFLLSDCVLSAYHTRRHRLPFDDGFVEYAKDLVLRPKFIQLRHGVCQNDTSATQNKWFDNPTVLLTVAERERQSMIAPEYGFDPGTVRTTGFPRFDLLYDDPRKLITFMPTWRQDLIEWSEDGHHRAAPSAAENPFVVRYRDVLADGEFISECERNGYKVCLKGHPNLSSVLHLLNLDPRVKVCGNDIPYRQMFAETSLLVTDYSSTAFDFAYLHKPVVYFQFDGEKFFRETYRRGYFDCVCDGFGPVCGTAEELKRTVLRMIVEGCRMDPVYDGRVSSFFAHDDSGNCKRTYDAVTSISKGLMTVGE